MTELFQKYNNRVFQPFNFLEVRNVMSVRQLRRVGSYEVFIKSVCFFSNQVNENSEFIISTNLFITFLF